MYFTSVYFSNRRKNIKKAVVRFKVSPDWIIKNNISTIQLQQYIHDDWVVMPTKGIGQVANCIMKYMLRHSLFPLLLWESEKVTDTVENILQGICGVNPCHVHYHNNPYNRTQHASQVCKCSH